MGDSIAPGDVLCEVETDKATIAWEAQEEGFLAAILLQGGSKDVAVGTPAAVIVEDEVGGPQPGAELCSKCSYQVDIVVLVYSCQCQGRVMMSVKD